MTTATRCVLAVGCARHQAQPGEPCWGHPANTSPDLVKGLCGGRIASVGFGAGR